jgi:hypothetical protein
MKYPRDRNGEVVLQIIEQKSQCSQFNAVVDDEVPGSIDSVQLPTDALVGFNQLLGQISGLMEFLPKSVDPKAKKWMLVGIPEKLADVLVACWFADRKHRLPRIDESVSGIWEARPEFLHRSVVPKFSQAY